jgi:hypothetical protein
VCVCVCVCVHICVIVGIGAGAGGGGGDSSYIHNHIRYTSIVVDRRETSELGFGLCTLADQEGAHVVCDSTSSRAPCSFALRHNGHICHVVRLSFTLRHNSHVSLK